MKRNTATAFTLMALLIVASLPFTVGEDAIDSKDDSCVRTSTTIECPNSLTVTPPYLKNSTGCWVPAADTMVVSIASDRISLQVNEYQQPSTTIMDIGFVYDGKYTSMTDMLKINPEMKTGVITEKTKQGLKYTIRITGVKIDEKLLDYVTLTTVSDNKQDYVELGYEDLKAQHEVTENELEQRLYIGDIIIKDDTIILDPTLNITSDTEMYGDYLYDWIMVESGAAINVSDYNGTTGTGTLNLTATEWINISGTIDGDGLGYSGGEGNCTLPAQAGDCIDGGSVSETTCGLGGSGAGHGGVGGTGGGGAFTATAYGNETNASVFMGSGGAGGTRVGCSGCTGGEVVRNGGSGGAAVQLHAPTIWVTGTIKVSGSNGGNADGASVISAAGGSGGTILLNGTTVNVTGFLTSDGGDGGVGGNANHGGGGAGGRVKVFYTLLYNSSSTVTVTGGAGTGSASNGGTGTIYYEFYDDTPPLLSIVYPTNNSNLTQSGLNITGTASDDVEDSIAINDTRFDYGGNLGTFTAWNFTYFYITDSSFYTIPDGDYDILITANDTSNNTNSSSLHFTVDKTAPYYSSVASSTPSYWNNSTSVTFNVSWADAFIGMDSIVIETNISGSATNYTMSNDTYGNAIYNYTANCPVAGDYYWLVYANDTFGNDNSTSTYTFTIDKITVDLSNGFSVASPIVYENVFTPACHVNTSDVPITFMRNGTATSNSTSVNLSAGSYNYSCYYEGDENHTSGYDEDTFHIKQVTVSITNSFDPVSPITYNTTMTPQCHINSSVTPTFYRNGTTITNNTALNLSAGDYNFSCNFSGNVNYSQASDEDLYIVNKNMILITNSFSPTSPTSYNTSVTPICYVNESVAVNFYRNGTATTNNSAVTLAAGDYNYTCSFDANENFTAASDEDTYTIDKYMVGINLYFNGTADSDKSYTQGESWNATAYSNVSTLNTTLYLDDVLVNYSTGYAVNITTGAVGEYKLNATVFGDANFTDASSVHNITIVTAGTPTYSDLKEEFSSPTYNYSTKSQQFNCTWDWNATLSNLSVVYFEFNGTNHSVTTNVSTGYGSAEFYYNLTIALSGLPYEYRWYAENGVGNLGLTAGQNYTVSKKDPTGTMNISSSSGWVLYEGSGTQINVSESNDGDDDINYTYFFNSVLKSTPYNVIPPIGTYTNNYSANQSENYTDGSTTYNLQVIAAPSSPSGGGGGGGGGATAFCGNGICEYGETNESCRIDCGFVSFSIIPKNYQVPMSAGDTYVLNFTLTNNEEDAIVVNVSAYGEDESASWISTPEEVKVLAKSSKVVQVNITAPLDAVDYTYYCNILFQSAASKNSAQLMIGVGAFTPLVFIFDTMRNALTMNVSPFPRAPLNYIPVWFVVVIVFVVIAASIYNSSGKLKKRWVHV